MIKFLRVYYLLILVFLQNFLYGQTSQFTGTVVSEKGNKVNYATVALKLSSSGLMLGYSITGDDGKFSIPVKSQHSMSDLLLEVNHLSYKNRQIKLVNNVFQYDFVLEESLALLDEVVIKSRPKVIQKKDTISYNVEGFARQEDRSIGDVLQRIPGMEVGENGEIKFNNKPISNFYIDGDDILGGKYGLGTKAIPHDMVKNIQIYNNHEHIKALKGKNSTDKVAINLEIKEDARLKFIGDLKAGLGTPEKYDADLNGILLNKNYKMLNVVKGNNIGQDLSNDILDLLSEPAMEKSKTLVSPSTISTPYVPLKRYFNNNSGMLNANNFFKFRDSLQLKTNFSFVRDNNKIDFNSLNEIYTQDGTIRFIENQSGYKTANLNSLNILIEKNKSKYYFKEEIKLKYNLNGSNSDILNNQDMLVQHLKDKSVIFSNNLSYIPILKNNNTLYIKWKFISNNGPQQLEIAPGVHEEIINNNLPYGMLSQYSNISLLSNSVSGSYRINKGKIIQSYSLDLQGNHQTLESKIDIADNNSYVSYKNGDNDNLLRWNDYSIIGKGLFEYQQDRIEASVSLPIRLLNIHYKDPSFGISNSNIYLLFNPSFILSYKVSARDLIVLKYNSDRVIDDITTLYRGFLFTNYRTLRNNENSSLAEQRNQGLNIDYNIKRPIEMFFVNIAANYSLIDRNVLTSIILTNEDVLQQSSLLYDNQIKSYGINASLSKYIFSLGATLTLKPSWNRTRLEELINSEIYTINYNSYELSSNLDFQLFKKVNILHKSNIRYIKNDFNLSNNNFGQTQNNYNYRQSLSLKYSPLTNFLINIENQFIHVSQKNLSNVNVNFIDINFRLKAPKWKMNFELDINNIMNARRLSIYSLSNTTFANSQYRLNPRIAILRAFFNF